MQLRLGQPVHAADGPFGVLADIVVDPVARRVTHVIVEPRHHHYQARLVPIWLIEAGDRHLSVKLDGDRIRQLQDVVHSEFLLVTDPLPTGDAWDIGHQKVVAMPYYEGDLRLESSGEYVSLDYDRIPKGECEIRRESQVRTVDNKVVGRVEGFLVDEEHLTAVVVKTGIVGLRHNVLVPMGSVMTVQNDTVTLGLTGTEFRDLPAAVGLTGPRGASAGLSRLEHLAGSAASGLRRVLVRLGGRAKPAR